MLFLSLNRIHYNYREHRGKIEFRSQKTEDEGSEKYKAKSEKLWNPDKSGDFSNSSFDSVPTRRDFAQDDEMDPRVTFGCAQGKRARDDMFLSKIKE